MKRALLLVGLCASACQPPNDAALLGGAPTSAQTSIDAIDAAARPNAPADACHPFLVSRTAELATLLNTGMAKILLHVERAIEGKPVDRAETTLRFERTLSIDVVRRVTIEREKEGSITTTVELAPRQRPTQFTKVMTANVTLVAADSDNPPIPAATRGQLHFDFDALARVVPDEASAGILDVTFDAANDPLESPPDRKALTFAFYRLSIDGSEAREGKLSALVYPTLGGAVTYSDRITLACPENLTNAAAEALVLARWFEAEDGQVVARADATARGAQMQAGRTWIGYSCYHSDAGAEVDDWAFRVIAPDGKTEPRSAVQNGDGSALPCDSSFAGSMFEEAVPADPFDLADAVAGSW